MTAIGNPGTGPGPASSTGWLVAFSDSQIPLVASYNLPLSSLWLYYPRKAATEHFIGI